MPIKIYKKTSPGRRFSSVNRSDEITAGAPEKSLLKPLKKTGGPAIQMGLRIKNYVERIIEENGKLSKAMAEQAVSRGLLAKLLGGRIAIIDTLYPGSTVSIAGLSETVSNRLQRLVYCVERGELISKPYTPS